MEDIKTAPTETSVLTLENRDDQNKNEDPSESNFECIICLGTAKDAVITLCGHLFWLVCKFHYENMICKSIIKYFFLINCQKSFLTF